MVLLWVGKAGHERIIETVEDRLRKEEKETDHSKPEAGDGPTKDHGRVGKANRYGSLCPDISLRAVADGCAGQLGTVHG